MIEAGFEKRPAPFRDRVKNVTNEIDAWASIQINTVCTCTLSSRG